MGWQVHIACVKSKQSSGLNAASAHVHRACVQLLAVPFGCALPIRTLGWHVHICTELMLVVAEQGVV